jgi:serine/threonine protein kinase
MSKPSWIGASLKGRYKIEALLGQGGMSAVYKATDPNLKRVVAIKLIHSHLSGDQQFVTRFETEAAAVAKLRHSNIVQVYDFDHDEDTYYMVLEFIPGESLNDRLKRLSQARRQIAVPDALRFLSQVCDALDYAHQRGLVHRDIKPANIMVDVQDQAILMDFGIVKILGGEAHTATGATLGTALYMSPEQVKGLVADHRADIYSLGVTLFETLSGNPPFQADSVMTVMMMHLTDPVPNLRNLRPDVPAEVTAIIEKAMAKDPQQRYQTAGEMAAAMRRALEQPRKQSANVPSPVQEEATVIEPTGGEFPPDSTLVEQSSSAPLPAVGAQKPDSVLFEHTGDTGPMPQIKAPVVVPPPVQRGGGQMPDRSQANRSQSSAVPARQSGPHGVAPQYSAPGELEARKALPWLLIAGGGIGVIAILGIVIFIALIRMNRDGNGQAALANRSTQTAAVAVALDMTPTASPTPSEPPGTSTITPTASQTPSATVSPTVTHTLPPTETPTPTVPPGILFVRINKITINEQNRYVVDYETFEFTEQLPGTHVHFFFDTVSSEQAGVPGRGPWILYGGPRPFTGYSVNDKPAAANRMCALVANPNHSIQVNSGTCYPLP